MVITSVKNEHIKELMKLKEKKYRDQEEKFLIEGYHLLMEADRASLLLEVLALEDVNIPVTCPVTNVSKEVMMKLSDMNSIPKVMAVVRKKENTHVGNRILILDGIQDPGNLGTMIRSALAFSFDTIVLSEDTVDLYNAKVIRSTQGMLFHVTVMIKDLACFIRNLKEDQYVIYGTNVEHGEDVRDAVVSSKMALIIGNEGHGVRDEVGKLCDRMLYIPMQEDVESLNASVAASILMYEVMRK